MLFRKTLWAAALVSSALISAQPYISFEENESWSKRVNTYASFPLSVVQEHAFDGKNSLKVTIPGSKKDSWPGFFVYISPEAIGDLPTLQFNVWHEEQGNIGLPIRMDFKNRETVFSSVTVPPRSRVPAVLFLNQLDAKGNRILPFRIFIYRRMPREDATLWFDNFRFAKVPPQGNPINYVPPVGHRQPTAQEKAIGAQFFRRNWMEHVFPNVRPLPSDSPDASIRVNACPGETEPATLSLFALKSILSATLTVTEPLQGPNGASIPPSAFTVYHLRCLDKRTTYQSKAFYRQIPMVLDRAVSFPVPADTAHSFWLDIAVPEGTPAGVYNGRVHVKLDDATQDIPVAVTVRPFTLPNVTKQFFGEYYTTPQGFSKTELPKVIDSDFAFMRSLGMTSVGLCIGPSLKLCKYADGKVTFALSDDEAFVYAMNAYVKYKYPCPVILLSDPGYTFAQNNGGIDNDEVLQTVHRAYWTAMQEECRKRGWPELIIQPVDEPSWQSQDSMDTNVKMLKMLKSVPGLRTEQDGPADNYFINVAGPLSDVWCFNGGLASPAVMDKVYADGKIALFYNCDVESYRPVIGRYSAGLFQYLAKCHGVFNWAMRSFGGSPFDDFDSARGDTTNFYPTFGTIVGGPGIGLVATREGIDDFRYVQKLQELIAAKPGPAANEAKQILNDILKSIHYSPTVRNSGTFDFYPASADGIAQVTGVFNVPNGWLLENYDLAREIIAGQIMKLLGFDSDKAAANPAVLAATPATTVDSGSENADAQTLTRAVVIPTCSVLPKMDGILDDACWQKAGKASGFELISGGKPDQQTTAWLTTDGIDLYIGVKCDEPLMEHIIANVRKHQGPVYADDCVEIFLDPEHKAKDYLQLCVNSLGYTFIETSGKKWTPQLKTAAHRDKDYWSVEIAIPLQSLGRIANSIGLNICRERRPLEVFELTCWSPTGTRFAEPSRFGSATFGHAWLSNVSLDNLMLGNGSIAVDVINPALDDAPVTVVGEYTLRPAKGQPLKGTFTQTVTPRDKTASFTQSLPLSTQGDFHLLLMAKNAKGEELEKLTLNKRILPVVTLDLRSPFVDENWQAVVNVNYLPKPGEKPLLAIWPDSAPQGRIAMDASSARRFVLSLKQGSFKARETLNLQLTDQTSKQEIERSSQILLTK